MYQVQMQQQMEGEQTAALFLAIRLPGSYRPPSPRPPVPWPCLPFCNGSQLAVAILSPISVALFGLFDGQPGNKLPILPPYLLLLLVLNTRLRSCAKYFEVPRLLPCLPCHPSRRPSPYSPARMNKGQRI